MASLNPLSYGSVEIYQDDREKVLGIGSYGKVCKAKCGQLPCAAKLLHETMFEGGGDPGIFKYTEQFEQECQFLSRIKHPNIVQYLGTSRDPRSQRLALLMELMDESLTRFLERSTGPIPYHIQLNICHDVALALSYLHSNAIIHRDLSSNNVLLIGEGSRAKVTDFGMSKLTDMNPRMTPLTLCPGATVYMPPEALTTPPHYSSKLDCFSHGVLIIQIITRKFPSPGDANKYIEDPKYPTGRLLLQFPETERRKKDIDLIVPDHSLLPIALHCIKDRDTERPSADEVCQRLATLKREEKYTHSVEQFRDQASLVQRLQRECLEKEQILQDERSAHQKELQVKNEIIERCNQHLQEATEGLKVSSATISIELELLNELPTPRSFTVVHGTAVGRNNGAVFSNQYQIFLLIVPSKWIELLPSNFKYFSMAIINDMVTTIGGRANSIGTETNLLKCLSIEDNTMHWKEVLPPMPTKRAKAASITTQTHLVVAGGESTNIVEVLDTTTLQWSTASPIVPVSKYPPLLTLCDGCFYICQGNSALSCSAQDLFKSCKLPSMTSSSSDTDVSIWTRLPDIPVQDYAYLIAVKKTLLAVGGYDVDGRASTAIHSYNSATQAWSVIGHIPSPRTSVLAAVLTNNDVVVVGGYNDNITQSDVYVGHLA